MNEQASMREYSTDQGKYKSPVAAFQKYFKKANIIFEYLLFLNIYEREYSTYQGKDKSPVAAFHL